MELKIHRDSGMWVVREESLPFENDSKDYPLLPDTASLLLVVQALRNIYPKAKVFIDPAITDNPLLAHKLTVNNRFHVEPDYVRVQYTLDNSATKECGFCGRAGWYNAYGNHSPFIGWWECPHCGARMHDDGTWFTLSRFARK